MPDKCKDLFLISMEGLTEKEIKTKYKNEWEEMTQEEREFVLKPRTIEDFKIGLVIPGKLLPKRIKGGVILMDTTYEMR